MRLICILAVCFFVSLKVRLSYLDFAEVNSDSLSPYLAAMKFWYQGFSDPPNPESDHWMWLTTAPWVRWGDSLESLFSIRFFWGACIAPIGSLCMFYLTERRRYISALCVGLLLALDKGLIDTLISSFRGYMAPEFIALATFFAILAVRNTRWYLYPCLVCVLIGSGHHSMALGALLGVLLLSYRLRISFLQMLYLCVLGLVCLGFRMLWLWEIVQCDLGGWLCIEQIATGSSEKLGWWSLLYRIVHDRFYIELGWASFFIILGWLFASHRFFGHWVWGGILGVCILGVMIATLRPYHLRIYCVPMCVLSVLGWSQKEYFGFRVVLFWVLLQWYSAVDITGERGGLRKHDALAAELPRGEKNIWVEAEIDSNINAAGVVLSSLLSGFSKDNFATTPLGNVLVVLEMDGQKESVVVYETVNKYLDAKRLMGGYDWAIMIHKEEEIILFD